MKRFSAGLAVNVVLVVALAATLGGCGGEPAVAPSDQPSDAEPTIIGIYSGTAAGGREAGPVFDVGTAQGKASLLSQLRGPLTTQLSGAIADVVVPEGQRLLGGIVSIDCAAPAGATLVDKGDGLRFAPVWTVKPPKECFAAVTAVALALVPDGWSPGEQAS